MQDLSSGRRPHENRRVHPYQKPSQRHTQRLSPVCPYCGQQAKLVSGDVIYPHRPDLASKNFWECRPCDAYVGCHEAGKGYGDGTRPMGRLANAALRAAKRGVHLVFDPLWREAEHRGRARTEAYARLAAEMGLPIEQCHIGEFDLEQCARAKEIARRLRIEAARAEAHHGR